MSNKYKSSWILTTTLTLILTLATAMNWKGNRSKWPIYVLIYSFSLLMLPLLYMVCKGGIVGENKDEVILWLWLSFSLSGLVVDRVHDNDNKNDVVAVLLLLGVVVFVFVILFVIFCTVPQRRQSSSTISGTSFTWYKTNSHNGCRWIYSIPFWSIDIDFTTDWHNCSLYQWRVTGHLVLC